METVQRSKYNAIVTAHTSSEREVKRMKKIVERAEQTVATLREENAELAAAQLSANQPDSGLATGGGAEEEEGATPTARVSLAEATPIADPRALPTVTEKEDLRQSLMKRSRTDSVVLARSASVRRQHTLSICWH